VSAHGGRQAVLACALLLLVGLLGGAPSPPPAEAAGGNLASRIGVPAAVKQLVTVTSSSWSDTTATIRVWRRRGGSWHLVRGPIRASLGWNGFVRARDRRQSTGTTPAGRFTMRRAFGTRADPGGRLPYRRVDADDFWPYEPRDPATYNIMQPSKAAATRWRSDYSERLSDYPYEYAYSIVLGFNLPRGVRWSSERQQYVARETADTTRGGGIFLHVKQKRYTAGCVSAPLRQVRWLVRWLDPALAPRIVMGPRDWVVRRF
jgi:L,D-peptidoglycan transpeptidase YkuD (ErfK/YbiS/YcfS/YnhG family)